MNLKPKLARFSTSLQLKFDLLSFVISSSFPTQLARSSTSTLVDPEHVISTWINLKYKLGC
jgi:hypothetical protein